VTGKYNGENKTAARYVFHTKAMKVIGREKRPRDHFACLNFPGVIKVRPTVAVSFSTSYKAFRNILAANECVCGDSWHTRSTDERRECNRRRQDSA
jgi:hypothetical protein